MPTRRRALQAAEDLSSRFRHMQNRAETHVAEKHKDLATISEWIRDHGAEAGRHLQGYGLLSFFSTEGWTHLYELIVETLLRPTSIHPGGTPTRAIFYRQFNGTHVGTFLTQQQIQGGDAPPARMAANFQVDGLIVVIDCNSADLVTAFPGPQPHTAELT